MANRIEEFQVLFTKRNARARGPTSSAQQNDMIDEIAHDLAALNEQWNNRLVPLTSTIPNGSPDNDVDAFTNGLDGRTLYVVHEATSTSDSGYYNAYKVRPNTVYEQFVNVYETIEETKEDLEAQLAALVPTASQIAIVDNASLYVASNVEDALAEVMQQMSLISTSSVDLSAVDQNYIPAADNVYDIGSAAKRIKDVHVGPGSVLLHTKTSDLGGGAQNKTFTISISTLPDATSGKLQIKEGSNTVLELSQADGLELPEGGLELADLDDVDDAISPSANEVLKWDGAKWVAGAGVGVGKTAPRLTYWDSAESIDDIPGAEYVPYTIPSGWDVHSIHTKATYGSQGCGFFPEGTGNNSIALGLLGKTRADAIYSAAIGYGAFATQDMAMAIGAYAGATQDYAIAFGYDTVVEGYSSIGIGRAYAGSTMIDGSSAYAIALGYTSVAYDGDGSVAIGNNTAVMAYTPQNIAIGSSVIVDGEAPTSGGYGYNTALGADVNVKNAHASIAIGKDVNLGGPRMQWGVGPTYGVSTYRSIGIGTNIDIYGKGGEWDPDYGGLATRIHAIGYEVEAYADRWTVYNSNMFGHYLSMKSYSGGEIIYATSLGRYNQCYATGTDSRLEQIWQLGQYCYAKAYDDAFCRWVSQMGYFHYAKAYGDGSLVREIAQIGLDGYSAAWYGGGVRRATLVGTDNTASAYGPNAYTRTVHAFGEDNRFRAFGYGGTSNVKYAAVVGHKNEITSTDTPSSYNFALGSQWIIDAKNNTVGIGRGTTMWDDNLAAFGSPSAGKELAIALPHFSSNVPDHNTGWGMLYIPADGQLRFKDYSGVVTALTAPGGGVPGGVEGIYYHASGGYHGPMVTISGTHNFHPYGPGDPSIEIGSQANASYPDSISIGDAQGTWNGSISIGFGYYGATGEYSVAIGTEAYASDNYSVAIGKEAYAWENGVGIGAFSWAYYDDAVAIGTNCRVYQDKSVGIGANVDMQDDTSGSIAIGDSVYIGYGYGSIAIGSSAFINDDSAGSYGYTNTIIGAYTEAHGYGNVVLGPEASSIDSAFYGMAIGWGATNQGGQSNVLIGRDAFNTSHRTVTIGHGAKSTYNASRSITIGENAYSVGAPYAITMGYNLDNAAANAIAMGWGAYAKSGSDHSIIMGRSTVSNDKYNIAIGYTAVAYEEAAIAIGAQSESRDLCSVAIGGAHSLFGGGQPAICYDWGSVAVGGYTYTGGGGDVAIGYGSRAADGAGIAIGYHALTDEMGISIGYHAENSAPYSISIGYNAYVKPGIEGAVVIGPACKDISTGDYHTAAHGWSFTAGTYSYNYGAHNVAIGDWAITGESGVGGHNNVAIGHGAHAYGDNQVVIGSWSQIYGTSNTNFGFNNILGGEVPDAYPPGPGVVKTTVSGITSVGEHITVKEPYTSHSGPSRNQVAIGSNLNHQNAGQHVVDIGDHNTLGTLHSFWDTWSSNVMGWNQTVGAGGSGNQLFGQNSSTGVGSNYNVIFGAYCEVRSGGSVGEWPPGPYTAPSSYNFVWSHGDWGGGTTGYVGQNCNYNILMGKYSYIGDNNHYASVIGYNSHVADSSYGAIVVGAYCRSETGSGNSFVGGTWSYNYGYHNVAIGDWAVTGKAYAEGSVAVGWNAHAYGANQISIGHDTNKQKPAADQAIAMGYTAVAYEESGIAIGEGAKAYKQREIAIGKQATANSVAWESIAIGCYSESLADQSVAIGPIAYVQDDSGYGVGIGYGSSVDNAQTGIAIGWYASAEAGNYATALGPDSVAYGNYAVAVGGVNDARGTAAISVGYYIQNRGNYNIAIGSFIPETNETHQIAIGDNQVNLEGNNLIAIGAQVNAYAANTIAIGYTAVAYEQGCIAMGRAAESWADGSVVIGDGAKAYSGIQGDYGYNKVALGKDAYAFGEGSVAIGERARTGAYYGIAIGQNANAPYQNSVALGHNAWTTSANQVSIGDGMDLQVADGDILVPSGVMGIGTDSPATSAALDIVSTTGALVMPRMSTTERDALTAVDGMVIYNTTVSGFQGRAAGSWVNLH